VLDELWGLVRDRIPAEIGGGPDDRHRDIGPDPDGDHVLRDLHSKADAGIEPIGDKVGEAVVDDDLDGDVGMVGQQLGERGAQDGLGGMFDRGDADGVPAGLPRTSPSAAMLASRSWSVGARVRRSRSPASVGATLRMVRARSCSLSRASSRRTIWLSADCDMPSFAAARVKLRSSATTTKAVRSAISSRRIHHACF
jgi:hypothetical protein